MMVTPSLGTVLTSIEDRTDGSCESRGSPETREGAQRFPRPHVSQPPGRGGIEHGEHSRVRGRELELEDRKTTMDIPPRLEKIIHRFASAPRELRGQALLRYAKQVPGLPPRYADHPDRLHRVHECQSPFFLATEVDEDGSVRLFFDCPPETPTVRGFAGILMEGLEGEHYETVLKVPTTFYSSMGLAEVVSPLRLRGMGAILGAIKTMISREMEGGGGER
jgi:cysteine desulfuration protein SufE